MKITKYFLVLAVAVAGISCDDFEDINKSTTGVTDKELGTLLYQTKLTEIQKYVIPIGSPAQTTGPGNDLGVTDVMSSGSYIGYFGMNNNWGFGTEATWDFKPNRMDYALEILYARLYSIWTTIAPLRESTDVADQNVVALFDLIKIAGWLRTTDVFGPMVYTNAGNGDIAPKLDSQETVYKAMLADLEKISKTLNAATARIMANADMIYAGDPQKWTKFANSLMLRLAVRTHFVDKDLARQYIEKALAPENGGVIESMEDEARLGDSGAFPLLNPFIAIIDYNEERMGATAWHYLKGYNDPRIEKYYTKGVWRNREEFFCVCPSNNEGKAEGKNSPEFASKPNFEPKSPIYWFRASETFFLKAEAALYNLTDGDAQSFYEQGVRMSLKEWGVDGEANRYLNQQNVRIPKLSNTDFDNPTYVYGNGYYNSNINEGNVSPKWSSESSEEKHLQQIITQKYLALYPNAIEAWTEYRRTGYPFLANNLVDFSRKINSDKSIRTPERFIYSPKEYSTNPNMQRVTELLGGPDEGGTKLWWVRSDRPKQN
ncbi:SusD/RagB family nutrient-binding outer membrane lipoprotein [Alistipes sp.]|uniref:SusD/RagB family nutrient-binding outer membrane lipoprotein n=1 Tax=Alistipes sp. TaxID=1872444 RepID=UPI0025C09274|nr:SusD/RagB family nutrient-binding outer membrane lipoprotein [Alistipes sp.]